MRAAKHYTNQTFTKRVDHEGGEHREPKNMPEPAYCIKCGAEYSGRRWALPDGPAPATAEPVTCPACKQIANGIIGGYLTLRGEFTHEHHEEIDRLIAHVAKAAAEDNPLSRLMGRLDVDGKVVYHTTTEHLAQRLGKSLEDAYGGRVEYDFSHENKVARVTWSH